LINEENNFKMEQKWPKSQNRIDLLTVWRAGSVLETALGVFGATLKRVEAVRPTAFSILEVANIVFFQNQNVRSGIVEQSEGSVFEAKMVSVDRQNMQNKNQ